jgi:3-oxoacyl-[acyl-carrier protein] reductase
VALCARHREALEETASGIAQRTGARTLAVIADVSKAGDCQDLVRATLEKFGRIDILVTNTGGPTPGGFDACDDSQWEAAVQSTLMNVVRLVRLVVPPMKARRWGRIVNVTSTSARQPIPGLVLSNALRPGILGLAKTLADELGPDGILVNSVCPGMHRTDRLLHLAQGKKDPEAHLQQLAQSIPVRRIGEPRELAAAVVFLCSAQASYITGISLVVDGGAIRGLS